MRRYYAALMLLPASLTAQDIVEVEMGGSTIISPAPYYAPQNVTINMGDTVRWTNVSGSHSANGSTALYPGNPEGFSSGEPEGGSWFFKYKFTIPGVYHYHCTGDQHAATQFGTVTVLNTTNVQEEESQNGVTLYPVPTNGMLIVELGSLDIRTAEVFSLDGQRVATSAVNGNAKVEVRTADLASGNYFLRLVTADGRVITRPFRKE